jgi:hypothetical protein
MGKRLALREVTEEERQGLLESERGVVAVGASFSDFCAGRLAPASQRQDRRVYARR